MQFILTAVLFLVLYAIFVKILSSILKGCFISGLIILLIWTVVVFIMSTREPVVLLNMFKIDNFKISRMEDQ